MAHRMLVLVRVLQIDVHLRHVVALLKLRGLIFPVRFVDGRLPRSVAEAERAAVRHAPVSQSAVNKTGTPGVMLMHKSVMQFDRVLFECTYQ